MFYKTQWAWQSIKLTRLTSIFNSKKVWKFMIITQLIKSDPKNIRGWKVPSLMPIRANSWDSSGNIWSVPLFGKISRCDMAKIALHWFVSTGRTQLICAKKRQRPSFFRCALICNGLKLFMKKHYTGSLAPADFSGAVFTRAHFQKIAEISSLCNFHCISKGILSLMHLGY